MKRLFSLLVLALSFSALFAQQTTVALLNHEGTITTYYGSEALVQAHKAAVHGDVITLSGGAFTAPSSWTKAVTLRGAGCFAGEDNSREVTSIGNTFTLAIPAEIETTMTFEGISFKSYICLNNYNISTNNKNTTFLKCHFIDHISYISHNTNFYNCIITKYISFTANSTNLADVNFFNCYVKDPYNTSTYVSAKFTNCIIRFSRPEAYSYNGYQRGCWELDYATCNNCIFLGNYHENNKNNVPSDHMLPSGTIATNCLSCYCVYTPAVDNETETKDAVYDYNIFDIIGNNTNKYLEGDKPVAEAIKSVFKTYNGTDDFSFNELYELTDEAKTTYIGSDGTQIGIHGGIGFDLVPSTLQITKCEVAPRSTTDGKLSVSIEVGIPE